MAVEINWSTLTTGRDGKAYSEAICSFVHDKFQQIPLPNFIKSVKVVSFDLGTVPPEIVIQDITDPYPEFYEDAYAEGDDEDEDEDPDGEIYNSPEEVLKRARETRRRERREGLDDPFEAAYQAASAQVSAQHRPITTPMHLQPPPYLDHRYPGFRPAFSPAVDQFTSPAFHRPANLHYFHSALSNSFSGALTPLASLQQASNDQTSPLQNRNLDPRSRLLTPMSGPSDSPSQSPPSTGDSANIPPPMSGLPRRLNLQSVDSDSHHSDGTREPPPTPFSDISTIHHHRTASPLESPIQESEQPDGTAPRLHLREPRDSDLQISARVKYSGDIRMEMTAELLIDYPAPSFVSLPVRLVLTGLTFDGLAIIANIRKRAHFCFVDDGENHDISAVASMLKEIRIESEIGEKGKGKQVLKNVGKVERFVLDRVRRILEDEFVFPSSWTFLL